MSYRAFELSVPEVAPPGGRSAASPPSPALVIEPPGRWPELGLRELWAYRGLFFFLVWSNVKARYAQTVLGAGWAVLDPVFTMVVFTVVFGNFVNVPSDGAPYALFSFAALVPWTYFSTAFNGSSNSLLGNTRLFTKVYFPRLVLPAAPVLAALVDFAIAFVILLLMAAAFGIVPSAAAVVVLPLLILVMMMTAVGMGCWLSALTVQYRDLKILTGFLMKGWMYASPVVYPLSVVPEAYRTVYMLNPLVGVIEGFRSVLLGTVPIPWTAITISVAVSFLILATGVLYFRRTEAIFADVA
jgi:lipopolysaccharide transport system permease protein